MNIIKESIKVIIIGLILVAGVSAVYAWTGPKQAPTGCTSGDPGCDAPINVSANAQQKTGTLRVGGFTSDMSSYFATLGGSVGIGTASPLTKLFVSGTANPPSLSASKGIAAFHLNTTQGLEIGGDSANPWSVWLQAKRTFSNDGTSWPLALNPLGGNVGIGTTDPGTNKLQVNGKIQAVGGDICTDQGGGKCLSTVGGGGGGGDITGVIAGTALTGGGVSGDVTLNLDTASISACTNGSNNKIYWDNVANRLTCGTDQLGGLTGGGTLGYLARWTSGTNLGNSTIYDTGGGAGGNKIGIGTASPNAKLEVSGGVRVGNDGSGCGPGLNKEGTIRYNGSMQYCGTGSIWEDLGGWNKTGNNIYSVISGNVGINDDTPTEATLVVGGTAANNTGIWSVLSDQKLKENIFPLKNALDTILRLQGVTFEWKDKERGEGLQRGFVAQDVQKVLPEWVKDDGNGYLMLEKTGVEALLVEAIKEQQKQIEELKAEIEELKKQ